MKRWPLYPLLKAVSIRPADREGTAFSPTDSPRTREAHIKTPQSEGTASAVPIRAADERAFRP